MNPVVSIIDLIKYALKALTAFLELRRDTYFIETSFSHYDQKEYIRKQIIKLRNEGTVESTDAADMLMLQLQERERAWKRAADTYFSYTGGRRNLD